MLWMAIVLAVCGAVAVRLATVRGRPQVWWWSFTLALLGIVVGSALLVDEAGVNEMLGTPNVAYLLSNLSYVVTGGAVTIYVHTLRRERPSTSVMALHAGVAALIAIIITAGWLLAPVHEVSYPRFRDAPPDPQAVAYDWLFHLYFLPVQVNIVVCCLQLVRRTGAEDPARRTGLLIIAASSSVDVGAHLLYLARLAVRGSRPALGSSLGALADVFTLIAVVSVAAGAAAFLVLPHGLQLLRAWSLTTRLRPLWLRTRDLHPSVALSQPRLVRHHPSLQAERMIIEITDGLRLLAVPGSHRVADPYDAVVQALRSPTPGGASAASRLPTPGSRLEEEEQVLALAKRYEQSRHAHTP